MSSSQSALETALKTYLVRVNDKWALRECDLQYLRDNNLDFTDADVVSTLGGGGSFYGHRWWIFPADGAENGTYKGLVWETFGHTPAESHHLMEGGLVEFVDRWSEYTGGTLQMQYEVGFANYLVKTYGTEEGEAIANRWYSEAKMKLAALEGELLEKMIEFLSSQPSTDQ